MGTLKKYRFRLAWQSYRVGETITPTGVVRDWLLSNGYVEPVEEAKPAPVPSAEPPRADEPELPDDLAFVRKRQRAFR